jgi:hypothetical protein
MVAAGLSVVPERHFPPPWSVEETDACFIVRDANGHALAYSRRSRDAARRRTSSPATRPGASLQHRQAVGAAEAVLTVLPVRSCLIDGEAVVCNESGRAMSELIRQYRHDAEAVLCALCRRDCDLASACCVNGPKAGFIKPLGLPRSATQSRCKSARQEFRECNCRS